jgi:hypothetical protein
MAKILLIALALAAGTVSAMAYPNLNCFVSALECPTQQCLAPPVVECTTPGC